MFNSSYVRIRPEGYLFLLSFLAAVLLTISCSKEEWNTNPEFRLGFSSDTVLFDTVFTSVGSVTRQLLVHNTSNKRINIESVRLARGSSSPFRINIDGEASTEVKDLEIAAHDSAYIFVKVTIDPADQNAPFIQTDSILFLTNGALQDVKLVAWGQDAVFYANDTLTGNVVFNADKPYVIYGNLVVDSLSTLTLTEGARLHFHSNSGMLIRNGASLQVNGTLNNPVLFRGDRLDQEYATIPGQWLGLEFEGGSTGNRLTYADIQNGRVGIQLDSSAIGTEPRVILYNCIIHNMVNYGILSVHSNIRALNCRISNCGGYTVAIDGGGKCEFRHCTISNYWSSSSKQFQALLLSNNSYVNGIRIPAALEEAYFGNCIVNGNSDNEIIQDSIKGADFTFTFDHCLVQTDLAGKHQSSFVNCIINQDPKFKDPWNGYFELDTLSLAKDAGYLPVIQSSSLDITLDLKGQSRISDAGPDLGSYERVENR